MTDFEAFTWTSPLKRVRTTYKARLTKFESFVEAFRASNDPLEILETKIEFMQSFWPDYNDAQNKIEELDANDNERLDIDDRYCLLVGRARALVNLKRSAAQPNIQQNSHQSQRENGGGNPNGGQAHELKVKLPIMSLPLFDGNPEQWLQFRDSFQGLIETNTELSDIQRMFYLRSALRGRAAEVIQALESSAANYAIAWNLLKKRFEDKTAIASRHLQLLLDIPAMQRESGGQLRQTLDSMLRHIRALEQLEVNTWDTVMIHILTSKLDNMTKREWRSHVKGRENVEVGTLTEFLEDRCLIYEPENMKAPFSKPQSAMRPEKRAPSQPKGYERSNSFAMTSTVKQSLRKCAFCQEESHQIYAGQKFRELSVPQKLIVVKERKLCRNCLRGNHIAENCSSSHCQKCESKHNTLLHLEGQSTQLSQQTSSSGNPDAGQGVTLTSTHSHTNLSARVILSTAQIWIHDTEGARVECRVLLDSGSQFNFITRELSKRLKLSTRKQICSVKGLGPAIDISESAGALIQSKNTAYRTKCRFFITERIIEKLPLTPVEIGHLKIPPNINLADNTFHIPSRVDVILGASIFWDLLCIGQIKLGRNQPILQKTHLGWIAAGDLTPDIQQGVSLSYL